MDPKLQAITDIIQNTTGLSEAERELLLKSLKDAEKAQSLTKFKLDRLEHDKQTLSVMLEESIEDLQKKSRAIEEKNKELQIETALERVRTVAMGMHKPDDLMAICKVVYIELQALGFSELRNTLIDTFVDEGNYFIDYDYSEFTGGTSSKIPYSGNPVVEKYIKDIRKSGEAFSEIIVKGEQLEAWKKFRRENGEIEDSRLNDLKALYYYKYSIGPGGIGISTFKSITADQLEILKRFRNVFDLSYKRYTDISLAEAQAREAQIEAALERVRSKAMSMQKSEDLANAVGIAFEELDKLNPGTMRCGIAILNKEKKSGQVWTTTKSDNNTVVQVSGDQAMDVHPLLQGAFQAWLSQKADYSYILKGDGLNNYYKALIDEDFRLPVSQSLVAGKEGLVQYYYAAVFSSGGLFAFRETEFPEESKMVLRRFADVFNLTYTRFNDLKIAETHALQAEQDLIAIKEAKQKAEDALAELQVTQKQLIQSEKMASLGELTAGIAHEIQNPLNFVNNFSEVSSELLDEMKTELEEGNTEEAKAIADDVKQNLEKILHHGKRADSIVKGMLQHSRTSSGQKEPTDINALADEYFRLAFHGLRAKDKSFNAAIKTDYNESIGPVKVLPQDLGRVILNLITNAFYAVTEKKKLQPENYEPVVTVSTRRVDNKIEVLVKDNGTGIPAKALEKIFQPFFTTKPTGQGTGLGLSLSYDIITQGHGGELKVETKEGEGTTFIISIPINN